MSFNAHHATAAAVAAVGAIGGAYYVYCVYKESQKVKIPESWTQVGTLKDLYIYPIKSCGPVLLNRAECSILGLRDGWLRDRIMMVVDEKSNFVTARVYPELLLVQPSVKSAVLTLKHADMESIYVNLAEVVSTQASKIGHVWGVPVPTFDCGTEVAEWLSRLIDRSTNKYRLVHYASQNSRSLRANTNKIYKFMKK